MTWLITKGDSIIHLDFSKTFDKMLIREHGELHDGFSI